MKVTCVGNDIANRNKNQHRFFGFIEEVQFFITNELSASNLCTKRGKQKKVLKSNLQIQEMFSLKCVAVEFFENFVLIFLPGSYK